MKTFGLTLVDIGWVLVALGACILAFAFGFFVVVAFV